MKFNKSLIIAALSLFAASGLFAKNEAKKDQVPGVAPQPAEFFYTGKPYDADLGAYTFNYRNYDPELKRWTAADPSGFPDGANVYCYINNNVNIMLDPNGLDAVAFSNAYWSTVVTSSKNVKVTLSLSMAGEFDYTLDGNKNHFTGLETGKWGTQNSSTPSFKDANGNTYTITKDAFQQTGSGVETDSNGKLRDWIEITGYFTYTTVTAASQGIGSITNAYQETAISQKFYGNWYE
jgi:RHS repeat-associated protein